MIGPNADVAQFGDYSGIPFNHPITPLMGIKKKIKDTAIQLHYVPWVPYAATQGFMVIPAKNLRPKVECEKVYGLFREYYPQVNFQGEMSKFLDETVDFDYRPETADPTISNAQTDKTDPAQLSRKFSVKWKGLVCPDITGEYQIMVQTRKTPLFRKAKVKVGDHPFASRISVRLEAGQRYPIEVQFPHAELGSKIELKWKLPSFHRTLEHLNFDREIAAARQSDIGCVS